MLSAERPAALPPATVSQPTPENEPNRLERALEPYERRMSKMKLPREFVHALLVPNAEVESAEAALQWAGMPNKNERALMRDIFDALAEAGFLEKAGGDRYRVIHGDDRRESAP